jgi:Phage protein (N4 Gp49/phage Sf6 gene 66) family
MKNGFVAIGHSTPASPENFKSDVGEALAYENAFRSLWQLEGYLLCEKLRGDFKPVQAEHKRQ